MPQAYDQSFARFIVWGLAATLMVVFSKQFRVGYIHFFAIGFLMCVLWSGVFAVNKSEWLYWALRAFLAITFLSVVVIDEKLLTKTMMLLGVVFICYFWWEYYKKGQFDGLSGLMKQHNYWAAAHFFVIPFCFQGTWKKLGICLVPVMVLHIILLNSRSTMAALVVCSVILMFTCKKIRWYLAVVLVLIGIGLTYTSAFNYDSLHQRFEQWVPTLKMIWNNPMGVGAGSWRLIFPHYAPVMDFPNANETAFFRFPHNDFLWIWAEIGIFGIICYLGMFSVAIKSAWKKKWLLGALIGYMVIAFFTACRDRPFASLMIIVLFAIACPRPDKIKCRKELLIPLTLLLVVLGFHYRASVWDKRLYDATSNSQKLFMTQGYSPFTTLTHKGIPYYWWKGVINYGFGNKELACRQFEVAHRQNPYNVQVLNVKGISMVHQNKIIKAREYFNEAIRICPDFDDARINLGAIQ